MSSPRSGLVRDTLSGLPRYRPGRRSPISGDGSSVSFTLSSNENPFPPVPAVLAAIARAIEQTNRYPDMFALELVEALADRLQVGTERVAVGTGSVGVLAQIMAATCESGDEVVTAWRSFEAYPIVTGVTGARPRQIPLTPDGRHDLAAMAAAVTDRTRVVVLCTPNNPTGPVIRHDEAEAFLTAVPDDVLIVIDEAYVEFVRDRDAVDSLALAARHENVAVLRTFSKAQGLAGLRVGYAVASPEVADALRATATPFGVSAVAQAAAVAALEAQTAVAEQVERVVSERSRVVTALRAQGWDIPHAEGNFVWFPIGPAADEFVAVCAGHGVTVRGFSGEGVRVTVAEAEANDILLDVAGRDQWDAVRNAR